MGEVLVPEKAKSATGGCFSLLGAIAATGMVGGVVVFVVRGLISTGGPSTPIDPGNLVAKVVVPRSVAVNEEMVVPAHEYQVRPFNVPATVPVQLTVQGEEDSKNGFRVFVTDAANCAAFAKTKQGRYYPPFYGLKVRSFAQTSPLPTGSYCAIVQNSENLFFSMTVRVQVVINP
jgi:hypothetical protein